MDGRYGCAMLAGGYSRRMGGRNKAELEYGDKTMAGRVASELSRTGLPCYLSSAAFEQELPEGWTPVLDEAKDPDGRFIGPLGGICSCLKRADRDGLSGLFFAPCDAPFYSAEAVYKLAGHVGEADAALWRTSDGFVQTVFGWYSVRCLDRFGDCAAKGQYKVLRCLETLDCRIVDTAGSVSDGIFKNINTLKDYLGSVR